MKQAAWGCDKQRFDHFRKLYGKYTQNKVFGDERGTWGSVTDHLCAHEKCIGRVSVYYDVIGYHVFPCKQCVKDKLNDIRALRESIGPCDFNVVEAIREIREA